MTLLFLNKPGNYDIFLLDFLLKALQILTQLANDLLAFFENTLALYTPTLATMNRIIFLGWLSITF